MTKEKELSMNQTFRQFMDAGLGLGSADVLNDIVNDKMMGFGTTIDEKIFNLDELKALIARQKEQSKDIDLNWEIKPLSHYTSTDENTAFFADELLLHATIGGESIEMYLRFSVVLSYVNNEWKVIHWHGSKPENVESEKDTWGIETWKEKAEALEKLVEERTADLKEKNRELEIEASLEKVRGVAMSMSKPNDLLSVCEVLFSQLYKIGFKEIRCALIHIFKDERGYFDDYDYSDFTGGKISTMPYKGNKVVEDFLKAIRKSDDSFAEVVVKGEELAEFISFRKKAGQMDDPRLLNAAEITYYFYSVGSGNIGISNFGKIENAQLLILKRFRNVFQLAYQRFTDISLAEAQAKESQIQLSLERVRARTMAMQKSDELLEVVATLYEQLGLLHFDSNACNIIIVDEESDNQQYWVSGFTQKLFPECYNVSYFKHPYIDLQLQSWKEGLKYIVIEYSGDAKKEFDQKFFSQTDFKKVPEEVQQVIKSLESVKLSTAFFTYGALQIVSPDSLNDEKAGILQRFANVFDQTYTRFLDLQNAEAQAREAQVEAALERVRSRTMGMHKSDELLQTSQVLFDQFIQLGYHPDQLTIGIMNESIGVVEIYATVDGHQLPKIFHHPINEPFVMNKVYNAWKLRETTFILELGANELMAYNQFRNELVGKKMFATDVPVDQKRVITALYFSKGMIAFGDSKHPAPETRDILNRFAKIFEQTYTRFLDLQKAEAQAREAQIESALERVRSRSLAMHHTSEIQSVIHAVHNELLKLNISIYGGSFIVINKDVDDSLYAWGAGATADTTTKMLVPDFGMPFCTNLIKGIKTGPGFFTEEFSRQQKIAYFTELFNQEPWSEISDEEKKNILENDGTYTRSISVLDNTSIFIVNQNGRKFTAEENDILRRFSKVFEQSYVRFLDLLKAEAQARESQIEAAVERVRAQSMAMHHPDDLDKVNKEILTQLNWLQVQGLSGVAFYLVDEDGWVKAWDFASPGNIGGQINYAYQFDFNRYEMLGYPFKMLQQTDLDYFVCDFPLEEIQKAVFEFEEIDPTIATVVKDALSTGVLTHQWTACARIFNGMLGIDLVSPPNEDTKAIVLKMAGAFNQAYTRFLDLQKAEAQAREAEINLAVERVRAKALAMQHSAEIIDVVIKLKDEVMGLHIPNVIAATIFLKESDDKVRMWDLSSLEKNEEAYHQSLDITFKVKEKDPHLYVKRVWENGADFFVEIQDGKGFKRLMAWLREQDRSDAADDVAAYLESSQLKQLYHVGKRLNNGKLVIDLLDPPEAEVETILTKMGAAFDLAYKRFEDLQNSEDQLREAKIEAALEKVRSRSLAMHSSQELGDVIAVVLEKLQELGFVIDSGAAAHINIFSEGTRDFIQWSAAPDQAAPICSKVPYTDNNLLSDFFDAKEKGLDFFAKTYSFEEKNTWFDYAFEHSDFKYLPDDLKKVLLESKDYAHWMAIEKNSCIVINSVSGNTLSQNQIEIQKRFAKVFEQSYVRFLDLQKAEAQARDGQIELALERVRARTMAMQKSDELKDVIGEVFDQFVHLEIHIEHTGFILDYKERNDMFIWLADGQEIQNQITLPYFDCAHWNSFIEAKKTGKHFFANQLNNEEKNKFYTDLFQLVPGVPEEVKDFYFEAPGLAISTVLMENVGLYIENFNGIPYTEEENEILKRFGNVFQQAYTRFLDLQKAEAQTKEAQIELSLERIRAKVTAMQRSTDLLDIVVTMRREFVSLGHEAHYFWHMRWLPDTYEKAMTSGDGSKIGMVMQLPRHIHGDIKLLADWEATDEPTVVMAMDGETAAGYVHKMISLGDFEQVDPNAPTLDDIRNIGGLTFIMSRTTHGEIGYSLPGCVPDPPAEGIATINRFAAVFDLAYRRFEDLQSSEKRIREAQIELAIERVRAQTLAMHKSEELANLSLELVKQVQTLGVNTWFCAFNIYDEDSQDSIEWGSNGQGTFPKYRTPREGIFLRYYQAGQNNEALFINEIGEDECPAHYEYLCTLPGVGEQLLKMKADGIPFPTSQIDHVAFFKYGYIIFITYEPVPESHVIFKRFAKVFEQTYSRFLDLQKAEAQAREAEIQLALERVRARSLAMHHTSELQDIVNEVARQLQQMGMNIDGGVFIAINEEINDHIELWASAGAADYVQKVRVPFLDRPIFIGLRDAIKNGNDLFNKIFSKEEKDEMFHHLFQFDPWSKLPEERKEDLLSREGGLTRTAAIGQYTSVVITNYHGIAFTDAEIEVLKRFNIVFEQSYIRFRDLQKAEQLAKQAQIDLENLIAAKKKTEETLTELKATQSQLIQSEKMASLGELTAGIAHEIQNPLNFVNNFSEVSKELLDEMKDALENGDAQEAKDLATDIIQNLEKITHHGKRADAIVKGMLQHSRSSSSQKEPANINTLTDEYLRLAYHGLRAKDKSFNATLKTDYDVSIGMVHIISQDMGRVILNLITNAFYAVTEKKKQGEENYEPTVSVGTKNRGSNIEIAVKDNGNGIPQNILDKIFQPFFTTKPTGEGTGLGLSLAYDIVKTHGGELTVDTKPGDGTTFKITIPVLKS